MTEHLKDLADFVRERGGGLLMIAGERYAPFAYKDSPLKDVLPIDVTDGHSTPDDVEIARDVSSRADADGPAASDLPFQPGDERENEDIWNAAARDVLVRGRLPVKRAAEVLAVHPKKTAASGNGGGDEGGQRERHPLVVQQFVGAGRSMFFGFDETWRWGFREDQAHYNQFWIQTVRYLARSRLGRVELRLDRQTPYRRGEPIKMTVRFPDDAPPPSPDVEVKVMVERRNPAKRRRGGGAHACSCRRSTAAGRPTRRC